MSKKFLGDEFDVHGGGIDLLFPHHENEIAQSRCANDKKIFAKFWMHNAFITMSNEKMAKSQGNILKIKDFRSKISCLLYTSPSPRDATLSRMPSSA